MLGALLNDLYSVAALVKSALQYLTKTGCGVGELLHPTEAEIMDTTPSKKAAPMITMSNANLVPC